MKKKPFKMLTQAQEARLSREELTEYYKEKREFYKRASVNRLYLGLVKKLRKIVLKETEKTADYEFVFLNDLEVPEEGFIVATNHKGFNDIPAMLRIMGMDEPVYPLMSNDTPMPKQTEVLLKLIGAVQFSRLKKDEKADVLERLSAMSAKGYTPVYWVEAVNNFTDSVPLYQFWRGIIRNAKNANKPIMPIVTFDKDDKMYVKFGKPFKVNIWDDEDVAVNMLRDEMFKMLYEIKEMFPEETREEAMRKYQPRNLTKDGLTFVPAYEEQFIYRPKNPYSLDGGREVHYDEVFEAIERLLTDPEYYKRESLANGTAFEDRNGRVYYENPAVDLGYTEYRDFDIEAARLEVEQARLARNNEYDNQIGTHDYDGPLRLIKRKSIGKTSVR